MAPDTYTETTYEGWGSRLMDSIKGVAFGAVAFLASFVLLFWNEGRAVKTAKSLDEGASSVVSVSPDEVDPANDKKLVHMIGEATTEDELSDDTFGVSAVAIKLIRTTEMYQWKEKRTRKTRKKFGGGRETTTHYEYSKTWSEDVIDSSDFGKPEGHENPGSKPHDSETMVADNVTVGAFRLSKGLIASIGNPEPLPVKAENLPEAMKAKMKDHGAGYYLGANPSAPAIGDLRITFSVVKPQTVSLIARQLNDTFEPYPTKAGNSIEMLDAGEHSADSMFAAAKARNKAMAWLLRLGGFVLMAFGLGMVFNPLAVVADVIPFLGDILRLGIGLFAGVVALALSLVTIAIAWLFYRPVLGIILLIVGVGAIVLFKKMGAAKRAAAGAGATPQVAGPGDAEG